MIKLYPWYFSVLEMKQFKDNIKTMKRKNIAKYNDDTININLEDMYFILYDTRQTIYLDQTPCNYGDFRYWYRCPICDRRCSKLYCLANKKTQQMRGYRCNKCANFHRLTLNRTKTDCTYYFELAVKEGKKIDPTFNPQNYLNELVCPEKPKGMHWNTYSKHYKRFNRYVKLGEDYWLKGALRIV